MRSPGSAEGKPQVEQYGLDGLAASAEAVLAGLGPLVAGLAGLAVAVSRAVTLDAMEGLAWERGRISNHMPSWRRTQTVRRTQTARRITGVPQSCAPRQRYAAAKPATPRICWTV